MVKRNDRWSALSMKERADLIKLYADGGFTNLKEIKNHYNSFGDGGDTIQAQQQAQAESSSFLRNWYSNPTTQSMLEELDYNDYSAHPITTSTGKEITDPVLARKYKTVSALNTPVNYVNFEDNHYGRHTMNSPTDSSKNFIEINEDLFGNSLTSTLIHEREHAVQTQMPFVTNTTQPVEHKLKPEYDVDPDLDKPKEVRSRIMETRNFFNLDPNKRDYTPAEAAEMQKQLMEAGQSAGSASQLNRLTPETMAGYLNYMASNDTKQTPINNMRVPVYEDTVNYAANGGRILDGTSEENQNLSNKPWYKKLYTNVRSEVQDAKKAIEKIGTPAYKNSEEENKKLSELYMRVSGGSDGSIATLFRNGVPGPIELLKRKNKASNSDLNNILEEAKRIAGKKDYTGVIIKDGIDKTVSPGTETVKNIIGYSPDFVEALYHDVVPENIIVKENKSTGDKDHRGESHLFRTKQQKHINKFGEPYRIFQLNNEIIDPETVSYLDSLVNIGDNSLDLEQVTTSLPFDEGYLIDDGGFPYKVTASYDGQQLTKVKAKDKKGKEYTKYIDIFDANPEGNKGLKYNLLTKNMFKYFEDYSKPYIVTTPWLPQ